MKYILCLLLLFPSILFANAIEIGKKVERTNVLISGPTAGPTSGGFETCSGTILTEDLVLTNAHCISTIEAITVTRTFVKNNVITETEYAARVLKAFEEFDVAVVKLSLGSFTDFDRPTFRVSDVILGEKAYVVGNPLGTVNTLTEGIISNVGYINNRSLDAQYPMPIFDGGLNKGNSGGAAYDEDGAFIGIPTAYLRDNSIGMLTPTRVVVALLVTSGILEAAPIEEEKGK